ncbi:MAG: hypothetical protein RM022_012960 [Nostoc sp. EfeVER01]|nr:MULTISPECIES: hypothetical protein [unclassified Nostoc]MDZ7947485.1 hypothetical protein [Nostoc sp. EfeVER01]MDZ7996051.1 hypothetical protein [Nostoc sp. EspVER01]
MKPASWSPERSGWATQPPRSLPWLHDAIASIQDRPSPMQSTQL